MCWHKWTKWEDIAGEATNIVTGHKRSVLCQERRCSRCNKAQRRRVDFDAR
jgi:hypothetical protein